MEKKALIVKTLLVVLFFSPFDLLAQQECSVKIFNTSNGMLQNTISGMALDNTGYLWMGTQNGLIRYDGSIFKYFFLSSKDAVSNSSNTVVAITAVQPGNKLMIRAKDGLVYTIKDGRPVLYSDVVNNTIYFYGTHGHFPNEQIFNKFNLPLGTLIQGYGWYDVSKEILPVNDEDFIVKAQQKNTLFYYKNGIKKSSIRVENNINMILKSGKYSFLKDENDGLYLYDSSDNKFNKVGSDIDLLKSRSGNSGKTVYYWDTFNDESYCYYNSIFYQLNFDPVAQRIKFIPRFSIDGRGHFWTGILYDKVNSTYFLRTLTEGLFQVKIKNIQTFSTSERVPKNYDASNIIDYAVLKTSDSTVLSTTGLQFTVSNGITTVSKLGNIFSNRETFAKLGDTAILCVNSDKLWYYSWKDGFNTPKEYNQKFNDERHNFIPLVYPEGDSVWVGTNTGIYTVKQNSYRVIFSRESTDGSIYFGIRLFYRLSNDEVFISNNFGLYKLKTSSPYTIDTFPEFKNKQVRYISRYKDMYILSVYNNGIYVYKNGTFYKVPLSEEQSDLRFCHSTYIDKNGTIWMTTNKGLFRSSVTSIVDAAIRKKGDLFFFVYGTSDGIANAEFNGGGTPGYALLGNGQIFYPSMGGIVTFKPEELNDAISDAPIPVEKIIIDKTVFDPVTTDTFNVSANFKFMFVDFSVPNFGETANLVLEADFDGQGWKKIPVTNIQRFSLLGDISPGYHKLVIRKRIGFGDDGYVYRTITIYKQKSLVEQIWFIPLVALAFILLVLGMIRLKTRSLDLKQKQLQKLVDEQTSELSRSLENKELLINIISHDMTTPLRHISFISDILSRGLEKDPEKTKSALGDIRSTADKILSGSLSIINWMKYSSQKVAVARKIESLHGLVNETIEVFVPAAKSKNITIKNEVSRLVFVDIDHNIVGTILNNLVSNAVKYSPSGEVRIFVEETGDGSVTTLKIKDSGKGIAEEDLRVIGEILKGNIQAVKTTSKLSTGLGYVMIAELIKIHGLSISIESKMNEGTTISIGIPQ